MTSSPAPEEAIRETQPAAVCGAKQPPSDQGESPEIGTKVGAGSGRPHNAGMASRPQRSVVHEQYEAAWRVKQSLRR